MRVLKVAGGNFSTIGTFTLLDLPSNFYHIECKDQSGDEKDRMQEKYGLECKETGEHARMAMECRYGVANGSSRLDKIFFPFRGNSNQEYGKDQADLYRHDGRLHRRHDDRYSDEGLDELGRKDHFDGELSKEQHPYGGKEGDGRNDTSQYLWIFEEHIKHAFIALVFFRCC